MKTLLVTVSVALAGVSSTHAQILRPSVANGAVVGAVAGGLIGGHNGDRWAQGALIGGVAGAIIGAALTPPERVYSPPAVVYQSPSGSVDYGQQGYGPPTTVVRAPVVPDAPWVAQAPIVAHCPPPTVVYAAPPVVYVERAPRVVYVPAPGPRVIVAPPPPAVIFGFGIHSGPSHGGCPPRHHHHRGYRR